MTLSTRNARGVVANLFAADARAQANIRSVVKSSGFRVQSRQKQLARVRTGFTRKAVKLRFTPDKLVYESGVSEEDYTAAGLEFYAPYLEWGTRFMDAHPFIFPPKAEEAPVFRRELNRAVRDAMRRAA
ncbi:MAG: hypothetical protein H0V43_07205 [Gemmatimonadales bacterium]|nr:hypothetical protein [Gemmatimonadales bacterium]